MGLIGILFLLLLVSPLLTGIVSVGFINYKYKNNFDTYLAFIFLGLSIGCINALKIPESDLINYIDFYENAGKYNYFDYLKLEDKEYLFFSINYLSYHILGGSFLFYIILFTGICYFLIFYAIRILDQHLKLGKQAYLLAIMVAVLFPNIFGLSAHLMRQFFAMSLILVFLVKNIFEGDKRSLLFFIMAVTIHTSSIFFGIAFIPFINKKLSLKLTLFFLVFIIGLSLFFANFSSLLEELPVIGYGVTRFMNRENAIWETENLGILSLLFQVIVLGLMYFGINKIYKIQNIMLHKLYYITLFLVIFILSNYNNTEIAARFNFYIYILFPIAFYFLHTVFNVTEKKSAFFLNLFLFFFFLSWFIYKINYGVWKYNNLENFFLTFI